MLAKMRAAGMLPTKDPKVSNSPAAAAVGPAKTQPSSPEGWRVTAMPLAALQGQEHYPSAASQPARAAAPATPDCRPQSQTARAGRQVRRPARCCWPQRRLAGGRPNPDGRRGGDSLHGYECPCSPAHGPRKFKCSAWNNPHRRARERGTGYSNDPSHSHA